MRGRGRPCNRVAGPGARIARRHRAAPWRHPPDGQPRRVWDKRRPAKARGGPASARWGEPHRLWDRERPAKAGGSPASAVSCGEVVSVTEAAKLPKSHSARLSKQGTAAAGGVPRPESGAVPPHGPRASGPSTAPGPDNRPDAPLARPDVSASPRRHRASEDRAPRDAPPDLPQRSKSRKIGSTAAAKRCGASASRSPSTDATPGTIHPPLAASAWRNTPSTSVTRAASSSACG